MHLMQYQLGSEGGRRKGRCYHMQASAPAISSKTGSGYDTKSFMITTFNFRSLLTESGSWRRESGATDVIVGFRRHCERTSLPIKPVQPVRMNFILLSD